MFIWNGKCPKCNILCTSVSYVGLGAPDIQGYYKAFILYQARYWWNPTQQTNWLNIEQTAFTSNPKQFLSALLLQKHVSHSNLGIINAITKIWTALAQKTKGIPINLLLLFPLTSMELLALVIFIFFAQWISVGNNISKERLQ